MSTILTDEQITEIRQAIGTAKRVFLAIQEVTLWLTAFRKVGNAIIAVAGDYTVRIEQGYARIVA